MSLRGRGTNPTEGIEAAADAVREGARPLNAETLDHLAETVGDSRYVLLGEATHGTSEFYRRRAQLTARLVRDYGFDFVAVEGDWTDCYEVNRYVKGVDDAGHARDVLERFDRWPTWMWANWEAAELVDWLREYNEGRDREDRAGFYGMDVYSLFESMNAVIEYLEEIDPDAAERARDAYQCFEPYSEDAREYAQSTRLVPEDCEAEVVETLADLRHSRRDDGEDGPEAEFAAEQNALVAKNAEEYYRAMGRGDQESWNVRDEHMVETINRLVDHYDGGKAVVWAHNTHVGDARVTDMADRGKVNVGQLLREDHSDDVAIVGFGGHRGTVIAGEEWGAEMERMSLPAAETGSYGDVFHRLGDDSVLVFDELDDPEPLERERGNRAVGVVYNPARELGNYVPTVLPERYDAFVHVEDTTALHPLHLDPGDATEPEAYPWGL